MRVINVMFDSLNRHYLPPYGCSFTKTPNFERMARQSIRFDTCYAGSLPCMPARRELHTGRSNFLHRSWGPLEPFDRSMPEILKQNGVYTHLISDHVHYWEDGGATYHLRYNTWENVRGQEGDAWKGIVGGVADRDPNLAAFSGYRDMLYHQDMVNRTYMREEKDHCQIRTFDLGIEFLEKNREKDQWFLQIECFDPHEPYFAPERFKKLYPHKYSKGRFDWPDYREVTEEEEDIGHIRCEYAALLSLCDEQLGRVLDFMDAHDMWKDTMLIVNTDHGFLLGEHGFWAKMYMPLYEEMTHIPLFIWDPRYGKKGESRKSLVHTTDIPATVLSFFGQPLPPEMTGTDLAPVIKEDRSVREGALFGVFGSYICCTDGRYVYMRAPASEKNGPVYEYTLMTTHMVGFFTPEELKTMQRSEPLAFTRGIPVMKIEAVHNESRAWEFGSRLYDVWEDPQQENCLEDENIRGRMEKLMVSLMKKESAPAEQYVRMGLPH